MKLKYKNLTKLFALASLMTGCVMRGPIAYETENEFVVDGKSNKKKLTIYGNNCQFTPLGNIWNSGTYGALGTAYGMANGWQDGFCNTNLSYFVRPFNGGYQAIKGIGTGLYRGMDYGFHLDYQTGRSVEGKIFDMIEYSSDFLYRKMKDLDR